MHWSCLYICNIIWLNMCVYIYILDIYIYMIIYIYIYDYIYIYCEIHKCCIATTSWGFMPIPFRSEQWMSPRHIGSGGPRVVGGRAFCLASHWCWLKQRGPTGIALWKLDVAVQTLCSSSLWWFWADCPVENRDSGVDVGELGKPNLIQYIPFLFHWNRLQSLEIGLPTIYIGSGAPKSFVSSRWRRSPIRFDVCSIRRHWSDQHRSFPSVGNIGPDLWSV